MKLIVYGKTNWEKDFPSTLEDCMEAKKYTSAFHSALSPILKELVDGDEHIMRVCSLLAIPPPPPRTPFQQQVQVPPILTTQSSGIGRGALKDLMKRYLRSWKNR